MTASSSAYLFHVAFHHDSAEHNHFLANTIITFSLLYPTIARQSLQQLHAVTYLESQTTIVYPNVENECVTNRTNTAQVGFSSNNLRTRIHNLSNFQAGY